MTTDATTDVVVQARGDVTPADREYAATKIGRLSGLVAAPVLYARVVLTIHEDPARDRPVSANGRLVGAHVAAGTVPEAVDRLDARLRERLERYAHRQQSKARRARNGDAHT